MAHQFSDADRERSLEARRRKVETALLCDNCPAAMDCKHYSAGSMCLLVPLFRRLPSRDARDCVEKVKTYLSVLEKRAHRAHYFEQLRGGKATKRVSSLSRKVIEGNALLARLFNELETHKGTVHLEPGTILHDIFGGRPCEPNTSRAEDETL